MKNKQFHAIDVSLVDTSSKEIIYIRLPDAVYEAIRAIVNDQNVIGFAWTATRDFGVIIGPDNKVKK